MIGDADMCPSIKLADHLVKPKTRSNDSTHHLVWCHSGYTNVSSTADAMLRSIFTAHSVIDSL